MIFVSEKVKWMFIGTAIGLLIVPIVVFKLAMVIPVTFLEAYSESDRSIWAGSFAIATVVAIISSYWIMAWFEDPSPPLNSHLENLSAVDKGVERVSLGTQSEESSRKKKKHNGKKNAQKKE